MSRSASLQGAAALVTGASGFVGRYLCSALSSEGVRVTGIARKPWHDDGATRVALADVTDRAALRTVFEEARPDFVFHLAAAKQRSVEISDYRQTIEQNVLGALNVAEACIAAKVTRAVYVGTCEEYGASPAPFSETAREAPISAYSASKASATHLVQSLHRTHGLPVIVLRPTLAYGPSQDDDMLVPRLIRSLLDGRRFPMTAGAQTRDLIYVEDVVDAAVKGAVAPAVEGKVFNIASGQPISIRELASLIATIVGPACHSLLGFGELPYRKGEAMKYWSNADQAAAALHWRPRMLLREGLERTVAAMRSRPSFQARQGA